ncbi:MAG: hypothetical protein ACE5I0_06035, partial [Candidatus Binatia bacterium]
HLQSLGGTHLRFIYPFSEVIKYLDKFPTPRNVNDPKMLKILESRRAHIKKVAATRSKGKP